MSKFFSYLTKTEKVVVFLLILVLIVCAGQIVWHFYVQNSDLTPAKGGIYREGIVGNVQIINPVFATTNDTDRDISRLVFSGLIKFNPETKTLEDDIATHTLSFDKKLYSFTIRPNAIWHDGTPVSADDVIYTYRSVIQNEEFPNAVLGNIFKDVAIEKTEENTVTFQLRKPYKFFLSTLTNWKGPVPIGN